MYMKQLSYEKFPKDSKARRDKATMLSERVYKVTIYSITTGMLIWILRDAKWLHVYLGGFTYTPSYFNNYPC